MDNGTNMTISDRELIEYLRDRCRRLEYGLELTTKERDEALQKARWLCEDLLASNKAWYEAREATEEARRLAEEWREDYMSLTGQGEDYRDHLPECCLFPWEGEK